MPMPAHAVSPAEARAMFESRSLEGPAMRSTEPLRPRERRQRQAQLRSYEQDKKNKGPPLSDDEERAALIEFLDAAGADL